MTFETRLTKTQNQLRDYFNWLTKDPWLAEDVLQFASIQAWRHWASKGLEDLSRLMRTAGQRYYFNHRQKEKKLISVLKKISLQKIPYSTLQPGNIETLEISEKIRQGLDQLPSCLRDVLFRIYFLDQNNLQVAAATDRPLSTTKTNRRRGLQRLRRILSPFFDN